MLGSLLNYDRNTIMLYVCIIIFSTILAMLSQSRALYDDGIAYKRKNYMIPYLLSFVCTAFFVMFADIGVDRPAYRLFFSTVSVDRILHGSEPGFELLQYIIHSLGVSPEFFLAFVSGWTVYNVYVGLWKMREELSLGEAIFIFLSMYYFQSFSLIRMYFAVSFLVRHINLLKQKKYLKYFILIILLCFTHYSMVIIAGAYILGIYFIKSKENYVNAKFVTITLMAIVFSLIGVEIIGMLLRFSSNPIVDKYSYYLADIHAQNVGFKWIFDLMPYVMIYLLRKYFDDEVYVKITQGYFVFFIMISLLSYSVPTIGRALIGLNVPVLVFVPMVMEKCKKKCYENSCKIATLMVGNHQLNLDWLYIKMVWIIWCLLSLLIYLSGYIDIDGLNNYKLIWG